MKIKTSIKPGMLIKVLNPDEVTLGNCSYSIIIRELESNDSTERAWHVLCGDRMAILFEHEFKVIK